jgi:hypothetical protein
VINYAVRSAAPLAPDAPLPPRARRRSRTGRIELATVVLATVSAWLWVAGWMDADPRQMTDFGLVSLFTGSSVAGLVLLTVSFALALRAGAREAVLAAHTVTFVVMIHLVPSMVFRTLRYAWTWKHVGIVDFITRHGAVDTDAQSLPVYHNWPGFFAGSATLQELAGAADVVGIATWAPLAIVVANVLALRFALRGLCDDRRRIWFAIWLFTIVNWVGQDYFSPQAFAFFLYLVVIGILLRAFRRRAPLRPVAADSIPRASAFVVAVLLMAAIAWDHQLTPLMTIMLLAVLYVLRQICGWYLPIASFVLTAGWALTVAYDYTSWNLQDLLVNPFNTVEANLDKSAHVRGAAIFVSYAGRLVIIIAVVLALIGIIKTFRRRQLDFTALLLMGAPGLLLFAAAFGGEMLFRILLFSSPFLCYFVSTAVYSGRLRPIPGSTTGQAVAVFGITAIFAPLFFLAYFGNDNQNYFTPDEIRVVDQLYTNAAPNSLLVELNTNYPRNPLNYEHFRYVSVSDEDAENRARILADPAEVLYGWVSDRRYSASYIVITRSQKIASDATGPMAPGSIQRVEDALRASPRFVIVYSSPDAAVFQLAPKGVRD